MIGRTCPRCQIIHSAGDVVAIGRFDPLGVDGYRSRLGGPVRAVRVKAHADLCRMRAPQQCECGLTDPAMPCLDCHFRPDSGGVA